MAGALALALLWLSVLAAPAASFVQKTTVRGTIGADIGGVWLVLHDLAPTFRVRVDRVDGDTVLPFKVSAAGPEVARILGPAMRGVVVGEFTDPKASVKYGIFTGDIITKVNAVEVHGAADYAGAIASVKKYALVMIRRPSLASTRARLLKIRYRPIEGEIDGTSALVGEDIDVRVKDVVWPFAGQLDKSQRDRELWSPAETDIKGLASTWHELVPPERPTFVGGEFELVAAVAYDPAQRKDIELEGTAFAMVAKMAGNPVMGGGTNIGIYGVRTVAGSEISGTYVEATLAAAPFPISIDFNGTFRMIKLSEYSNKDVDLAQARKAAEIKSEQAKLELAPDVPPPAD